MGKASIPKLVEGQFVDFFDAESWNSGSYPVPMYESLGAQTPSTPFMRVRCVNADQEPAGFGNFKCSIQIEAFTATDPEFDLDFSEAANYHSQLCGNINESLFENLTNSTLSGSITGYSNSLAVYDIQIIGFERDIDTEEGVFTDTWNLLIYCSAN